MTDLPERLRESARDIESVAPGDNAGDPKLCREAADEIERLHKLLEIATQLADHTISLCDGAQIPLRSAYKFLETKRETT